MNYFVDHLDKEKRKNLNPSYKKKQVDQMIDKSIYLEFGDSIRTILDLDNLERDTVINLAKYLGLSFLTLPTFILQNRIQNHIRFIQKDDQLIWKEGVSSLSLEALVEACYSRGLPISDDTPKERLLQNWVEMSINGESTQLLIFYGINMK